MADPNRRTAVAVVVAVLLLVGCSTSKKAATGLPVEADGPPLTYVAVGASESVGIGADDPTTQAWTQVLYRDRSVFPRNTTFVNAGIAGAKVADALQRELPTALDSRPQVVTVWLNVNDILGFVPVATYERQLADLVHQLRQGGTAKVFVANVPPVDELPAYLACRPDPPAGVACAVPQQYRSFVPGPDAINGIVDQYDAAIARVIAKEGAVLVDLHAAGLAARTAGTEASLVGADGFHPSTKGHEAVAATFAMTIKASGGPRP